MYNIIQLNDKNLSELQSIAQELGIKKTDSLKKEELVYKILDEQAIAGATKKVAAEKLKEERKVDRQQKRTRVTVKKESTDKVFTANKNGDLTKAKAEASVAVAKVQPVAEAVKTPVAEAPKAPVAEKEVAVAATAAPENTETPNSTKRKPGRPRKAKVEEKTPIPAPVPVAKKEEPKKAEPELNFETEVPKVIKKVVVEDSPILAEPEDDFIPIEDLPTEKVELPSELLGKFEATKAETPAVPVVESIPANQRPRLRPRDNNNNTPYNNNNNNNNRNNNPRPVQQQRPAQPNANNENYSPVPERRPVIEREKVYEFDDILTGTGVLEIMQDGYGFLRLPTIITFLHQMIFMYRNLKSNCLA